MKASRRQFLEFASLAAGAIITGSHGSATASTPSGVVSEAQGFVDRISFAPWMNDVRTEPLPFSTWPPDSFDDLTVSSLRKTLELNAAWGYNYFDIYGLFATWGWPANLDEAASPERVRRVEQVLRAAHDNGIKVVYGMGVYSWGFDEIIKKFPEVHTPEQEYPNEHVMCASKEEAWLWQKKLVDFVLQYDIDGFHLESADLGRCTCAECMKRWPRNPDYHNYVTSRTARYIRSVRPDMYIVVTLISWADWTVGLTEEDDSALIELSKSVDCIVDQGHHANYVRPPRRKGLIDRLECRFGTSGGLWTYPAYVWDRLQWFLPYPKQTGTHMLDLYADGGRSVMYYQGPPNNPGAEINIAFGGQFMNHPDRSVEENLSMVLEGLYKPKSPAALDRLVKVVRGAEDAYFDNMDWDADHFFLNSFKLFPGPGELHLSLPVTGLMGTPYFMLEPHMTQKGRLAYNGALEACLKNAWDLEDQFEEDKKVKRLRTAMLNTLMLLHATISSQQWAEQKAAEAQKAAEDAEGS